MREAELDLATYLVVAVVHCLASLDGEGRAELVTVAKVFLASGGRGSRVAIGEGVALSSGAAGRSRKAMGVGKGQAVRAERSSAFV